MLVTASVAGWDAFSDANLHAPMQPETAWLHGAMQQLTQPMLPRGFVPTGELMWAVASVFPKFA